MCIKRFERDIEVAKLVLLMALFFGLLLVLPDAPWYDALDLLEDNDRVVFKGPAGPERPFLQWKPPNGHWPKAKESCFSVTTACLEIGLNPRPLAIQTIQRHSSVEPSRVFLLEIRRKPAKGANREYWRKALPERALERLLDDEPVDSLRYAGYRRGAGPWKPITWMSSICY